ncbi:hypothetical protein EV368DRAFT_68569 [Lentinula lateritia]|nr:hypothetical protein EV368DRAFT_68569 [Lentinula lateritia]
MKHKQSVTSSSLVILLSSPELPIPELINTGEPDGLRGGDNYIAGPSPSSSDFALDSELPSIHTSFIPTTLITILPHVHLRLAGITSLPSPSSSSPSGPSNCPAITVTPIASPGESVDSYLNDGLFDPALLEVRSLQSARAHRAEESSESLVDYVNLFVVHQLVLWKPAAFAGYTRRHSQVGQILGIGYDWKSERKGQEEI